MALAQENAGIGLRRRFTTLGIHPYDTVTVVDMYRPEQPTVAGSVRDGIRLKQVVATWVHYSGDYVIAIARGMRPTNDGRGARYTSLLQQRRQPQRLSFPLSFFRPECWYPPLPSSFT